MRRSIHINSFRPPSNLRHGFNPAIRPFFTRPSPPTPITTRLMNFSKITGLLIALLGSSVYLSDTRAGLHSWIGVPLIKALASQDPEESHKLAIKLLKFVGAHHLIQDRGVDGDQLAIEVSRIRFNFSKI